MTCDINVESKGGAAPSDAALVSAIICAWPDDMRRLINRCQLRFWVGMGNALDAAPELGDIDVREWPIGTSWADVAGCYWPAEKAVIVSIVEIDGKRQIAPPGNKHGSSDLLLHETMHGLDYRCDKRFSGSEAFVGTWLAQRQFLHDHYFTNCPYGLEECLAESGAAYLGSANNSPFLPAFSSYWRSLDWSQADEQEMDPRIDCEKVPTVKSMFVGWLSEGGDIRAPFSIHQDTIVCDGMLSGSVTDLDALGYDVEPIERSMQGLATEFLSDSAKAVVLSHRGN